MPFNEKFLTVPAVTEVAGRHMKRYHVHAFSTEIEESVQEAAYCALPGLLAEPDPETPPAGFVILHRNSQGAFLVSYSWVWGNVLECHSAAAGIPFLGCADTDPTHFVEITRRLIGCVWELAPLEHERSSWIRHVLDPESPDLSAYLADLPAEGPVGAAS